MTNSFFLILLTIVKSIPALQTPKNHRASLTLVQNKMMTEIKGNGEI